MTDTNHPSAAITAHHRAWVAAGLRRAATEAGLSLPVGYTRALAADGLARGEQLGVTRSGDGVVIHTAPERPDQLPFLLGYADPAGQWFRDGTAYDANTTDREAIGR